MKIPKTTHFEQAKHGKRKSSAMCCKVIRLGQIEGVVFPFAIPLI